MSCKSFQEFTCYSIIIWWVFWSVWLYENFISVSVVRTILRSWKFTENDSFKSMLPTGNVQHKRFNILWPFPVQLSTQWSSLTPAVMQNMAYFYNISAFFNVRGMILTFSSTSAFEHSANLLDCNNCVWCLLSWHLVLKI